MKLGLFSSAELSNESYHDQEGEFYSSSQLKTALDDIEMFNKIYNTKELLQDNDKAVFHIGTHYHTQILEPQHFDRDCAVYPGKVRRGKEWEQFAIDNKGKAIITAKEALVVDNLCMATKKCSTALEIMKTGEAEVSCGVSYLGLDLKARADWIDPAKGIIMDLKSTTGNAKDLDKVVGKIEMYQYDLSAALYVDVFNEYYRQQKMKERIHTFQWVFASKDYVNCKVYNSTPEMLAVGRAKYQEAIRLILKAKKNNWVFHDEISAVKPNPWTAQKWLEGNEKPSTQIHSNTKPSVRTPDATDLL